MKSLVEHPLQGKNPEVQPEVYPKMDFLKFDINETVTCIDLF